MLNRRETNVRLELKPRLVEAVGKAKAIIESHQLDEICRNWNLGNIARDMGDSAAVTYGRGAVARLSREIGVSQSLLYEYAKSAKQWTSPEINKWLSRAKRKSFKLTWTHFVVLQRKELSGKDRRLWLARAIRRRLSAQHLREAIDAALGIVSEKSSPLERALGRLAEVAPEIRRLRDALKKSLEWAPTFDRQTIADVQDALRTAERMNGWSEESARLLRQRLSADTASGTTSRNSPPARSAFSSDLEKLEASSGCVWGLSQVVTNPLEGNFHYTLFVSDRSHA